MIDGIKKHIYPGGWEKTKHFTLNDPLLSAIYTIAITILALSCFFYFPPFGYFLSSTLFAATLIIDAGILLQFSSYKKALQKTLDGKCKETYEKMKDLMFKEIGKLFVAILYNK